MNQHEKNSLRVEVEAVMRGAGKVLLEYFNTRLTRHEKGNNNGFVTEADLASEKYLIAELKRIAPQASIFSEEAGALGHNDYCWVIDPLDGTTNFAHGLPYFCISVALTYQETPIFGAIYQPLLDEFFYAFQGGGAFLNGKQITVDRSQSWEKSMIVVGLPYGKGTRFMELLNYVTAIAPQTYSLRLNGAVALDQAYLACGRIDGLFFEDLAWWDVAAGMLLITESGGKVSDFQGNALTPSYKTFAAGNEQVHKKFLQLFGT